MNTQDLVRTLIRQKGLPGVADAVQSFDSVIARALVDKKNKVQIDPDDLPGSLARLLEAGGDEGTLLASISLITRETPQTGFSQPFNSQGVNETVVLSPAGTLATGTITLPTDGNSIIGQRLKVVSSQIVTALTVGANGNTLVGTPSTALAVNIPLSFVKIAAGTWEYLSPNLEIAALAPITTPVIPLTAFALAFNGLMLNETLALTPAGTLAAGTVTLPSDANSVIGQKLVLTSSQIVTALTVAANGNTLLGTPASALAVNIPVTLVKVAASTWAYVSPAAGNAGSITTPVTPVTAFSQAFNTLGLDEFVYLTPAGTLANGTVVFPTDAQSRIGQKITLVSTQTQSALTVTSSSNTIKGAAVTALTANVPVIWQKVAASTWMRLQ